MVFAPTEVELTIHDGSFTEITSAVKTIPATGWYLFRLPVQINSVVLPGAAVYVGIRSTDNTSEIYFGAATTYGDIANLATYPNKYMLLPSLLWQAASPANAYVPRFELIDSETQYNVAGLEVIDNGIRNRYIPFDQRVPRQGESEMTPTGDYGATATWGVYDIVDEPIIFNEIAAQIYCADLTSAVEWKVFVRNSGVMFDASVEVATASGSFAAGAFPSALKVNRINFGQAITAGHNQYVFVLFMSPSGQPIHGGSWAYDAGVTPARKGFVYKSAVGWGALVEASAATSYGATGFKLRLSSEELVAEAVTIIPNDIDIALPEFIYAVDTHEMNIYFDNLLSVTAENYAIDVDADYGVHQNERWTLTNDTPGSTALTVRILDEEDWSLRASASTTLVQKAVTVGNGVTKTCLCIGDSTTAGGQWVGEVVNLMASDVMSVNMIGTKGTAPAQHEGISGWAIDTFYNSISSPFYNSGIGGFDFGNYLTVNGLATPDYVFFHLGINDLLGRTTDAEVAISIGQMTPKLDAMIADIQSVSASINIAIMLTIMPSRDQDAFGSNYGSAQSRKRFKRNIHLWNMHLIATYGGLTGSGIHLPPVSLNLDTYNNMLFAGADIVNSRSLATVDRQNNGVHPATSGYYQMADSVYAFLKGQEV